MIIMNQSKKKNMKKCCHDSLPRTSLMFNKSFVTSKYKSLVSLRSRLAIPVSEYLFPRVCTHSYPE